MFNSMQEVFLPCYVSWNGESIKVATALSASLEPLYAWF
jgi:hypothetical protein